MGLTDNPRLQAPLFVLFLLIYATTLAGNLGMVVLIRSSGQLQTPMYFFLSSLSLLDACYSTVVAPRTLVNFLTEKKTISLTGCAAQMFFFHRFWDHRVLPAGCHGIRPLRGHLQPSALHGHHVSTGLHPAGGRLIHPWAAALSGAHGLHLQIVFLPAG